jgi:hypothetical protein
MGLRRKSPIVWVFIVFVLSAGVFLSQTGVTYARSSASCDSYARSYADRHTNTGGNVLGGAMGGAALGALGGAIAGKPGVGAGIGAGVGVLGGGVASANDWSYLYNRAYDRCMRR